MYLMDALTGPKNQAWMLLRLRTVLDNPWFNRTLKMPQLTVRLFKQKALPITTHGVWDRTCKIPPNFSRRFNTSASVLSRRSSLPACSPVCWPVATSDTAYFHIWVLSECNGLGETRPHACTPAARESEELGFQVFSFDSTVKQSGSESE